MKLAKMQVEISKLLIVYVRGRAAKARREGRSDVGASAIEWAIIAAICVTLALVVAGVVREVVESREGEIGEGVGD